MYFCLFFVENSSTFSGSFAPICHREPSLLYGGREVAVSGVRGVRRLGRNFQGVSSGDKRLFSWGCHFITTGVPSGFMGQKVERNDKGVRDGGPSAIVQPPRPLHPLRILFIWPKRGGIVSRGSDRARQASNLFRSRMPKKYN